MKKNIINEKVLIFEPLVKSVVFDITGFLQSHLYLSEYFLYIPQRNKFTKKKKERLHPMGFEPTLDGLEVHCLVHLGYECYSVLLNFMLLPPFIFNFFFILSVSIHQ